MMCSARELELGEGHDGIIELPADAPVGTDYRRICGSDPVFDVAITPNRPDCMGVNGIARDLIAAKLGMPPVNAPGYKVIEGAFPFPANIGVEPDSGCHIFWGRVIRGVTNGPSPDWLQARLKAVGLRPISALVDITNFFALDQARPLHVYDMAKLSGPVVARRGREGESFLALNGKDYTVTPRRLRDRRRCPRPRPRRSDGWRIQRRYRSDNRRAARMRLVRSRMDRRRPGGGMAFPLTRGRGSSAGSIRCSFRW